MKKKNNLTVSILLDFSETDPNHTLHGVKMKGIN